MSSNDSPPDESEVKEADDIPIDFFPMHSVSGPTNPSPGVFPNANAADFLPFRTLSTSSFDPDGTIANTFLTPQLSSQSLFGSSQSLFDMDNHGQPLPLTPEHSASIAATSSVNNNTTTTTTSSSSSSSSSSTTTTSNNNTGGDDGLTQPMLDRLGSLTLSALTYPGSTTTTTTTSHTNNGGDDGLTQPTLDRLSSLTLSGHEGTKVSHPTQDAITKVEYQKLVSDLKPTRVGSLTSQIQQAFEDDDFSNLPPPMNKPDLSMTPLQIWTPDPSLAILPLQQNTTAPDNILGDVCSRPSLRKAHSLSAAVSISPQPSAGPVDHSTGTGTGTNTTTASTATAMRKLRHVGNIPRTRSRTESEETDRRGFPVLDGGLRKEYKRRGTPFVAPNRRRGRNISRAKYHALLMAHFHCVGGPKKDVPQRKGQRGVVYICDKLYFVPSKSMRRKRSDEVSEYLAKLYE